MARSPKSHTPPRLTDMKTVEGEELRRWALEQAVAGVDRILSDDDGRVVIAIAERFVLFVKDG